MIDYELFLYDVQDALYKRKKKKWKNGNFLNLQWWSLEILLLRFFLYIYILFYNLYSC